MDKYEIVDGRYVNPGQVVADLKAKSVSSMEEAYNFAAFLVHELDMSFSFPWTEPKPIWRQYFRGYKYNWVLQQRYGDIWEDAAEELTVKLNKSQRYIGKDRLISFLINQTMHKNPHYLDGFFQGPGFRE